MRINDANVQITPAQNIIQNIGFFHTFVANKLNSFFKRCVSLHILFQYDVYSRFV